MCFSTEKEKGTNGIKMISHLLTFRNKMKPPITKTKSAYLAILLMIAGDISTNPGPKNELHTTSNSESSYEETAMCGTCNQMCHLQCNPSSTEILLQRSFEYNCSNLLCLPTYQVGKEQNIPVSWFISTHM